MNMQFVIRLTNGVAVKFHHTLRARNVYSVATDKEASKFDAKWEAELKAKECGMKERDFYADEINAATDSVAA